MAKVEMLDMSTAQLAFQVESGDVADFQVMRFRGSEGLCQLFRFEIEVVSTLESIAFDDIVGSRGTLSINTEWGSRYFHGVVGRFELTGETKGQTYYRIEMLPAVWLLTHRYGSRIFQGKTTKEIIEEVFKDGGIDSTQYDSSGIVTRASREYCVQYRETDYNFICRLLEEEGARWYFTQTKEDSKFVMTNQCDEYAPIEGESADMPYHPPTSMVAAEHLFKFRLGQCVRIGAVVLQDYAFKNPTLNLEAKHDLGRDKTLEFADYPGLYKEQSPGKEMAKCRAEEFESQRIQGFGMSNSPRLAVGKTFNLIEHPSPPTNRSYLITSITHQGKQAVARTHTGGSGQQVPDGTAHRFATQWLYHNGEVCKDPAGIAAALGANPLQLLTVPNLLDDEAIGRSIVDNPDSPVYESRLEFIPAEVKYRPPRVTQRPIIRGTQTARVVGPGSAELHCDEYGRVRVQFNWDREGVWDDKASCWIRVSHGMVGGGYGSFFLPRVGQEVIVDFLEGNPDHPVIIGRLHNDDHKPPYKLPDESTKSVIKTHSSKGGGGTNEIRFEDKKGNEQVLFYAQKDLHCQTNNDRIENVDNDYHLSVKKKQFEKITEDKHVEVVLDFNEKIGGNKSLTVEGNVGEAFSGNHHESAANIYLKGDKEIVIEAAGKKLTLKGLGGFITIDASGICISGNMVKINSGGSAGTGTKVKPKDPKKPKDADEVEPGVDTAYSGKGARVSHVSRSELAGYEFKKTEVELREPSWVDIELKDSDGNPVPYERFRVVTPTGKVINGSLDKNGRAHVITDAPGECEITYPKLDERGWKRS